MLPIANTNIANLPTRAPAAADWDLKIGTGNIGNTGNIHSSPRLCVRQNINKNKPLSERNKTMQNFDYMTPTRLIFGKGAVDKLPEALRPYGKRVLLAYGGGSIM